MLSGMAVRYCMKHSLEIDSGLYGVKIPPLLAVKKGIDWDCTSRCLLILLFKKRDDGIKSGSLILILD